MDTLSVKVVGVDNETAAIKCFTLQSTTGEPLPAYSAGAHIDVHLEGGITRQYSLFEPCRGGDCYRIAVLRDTASRGGSQAMHDTVRVGDVLNIGTPKNLFPLSGAATHYVLIAGGIGITPIMSMAAQLHAEGASFELHYCAQSVPKMAFYAALQQAEFADKIH